MATGERSGIPPGLWRRIRRARHRLLMLDYDGTLAPLTVERAEARPAAATVTSLRALAARPRTRVVIVSGRPLRELERLLGAIPVHRIGEHGWEERRLRGRIVRHRLPAAAALALEQAERIARRRGWSAHLERKRSGLVIHTRVLAPPRARALARAARAAWAAIAPGGGLKLEPIHGGIELRAAARNKGSVARALASEAPRGTLAVYVGDDRTDEDAFQALRAADPNAVTVRVGTGSDEPAAGTHAEFVVADPDAMRQLLEWLRDSRVEPEGTR